MKNYNNFDENTKNVNPENYNKFYENTKNAKPHFDTVKFISLGVTPGFALEIGCGAGRDSVYLIKNGWNVIGIDRENTENIIREKLSDEENKKFKFICADINELFSSQDKLTTSTISNIYTIGINTSFSSNTSSKKSAQTKKVDLILSNFTLPFCGIDMFDNLWKSITSSIKTDGYFVGNFFGINDSWAKSTSSLKNRNKAFFLTKGQVLKLFENSFEIIDFQEIEKDALTGIGKMKHWHLFNVIAKKVGKI